MQKKNALKGAETMKEQEVSAETNKNQIPMDIEKALERSMGDKEFLEEILKEFVSGLPEQLEALETAVTGGDGESIAHQAHTMKGASANLGANDMAAAALKLEQMGKESNLNGAREAIDALGKELQRLKDFTAGGIYT